MENEEEEEEMTTPETPADADAPASVDVDPFDDEDRPQRINLNQLQRNFSDDIIISGEPTPADYALAAKHRELLETSSKRPAFLRKLSTAQERPRRVSASQTSTVDSWFGDDDDHDHDHEDFAGDGYRPPYIPPVVVPEKTAEELEEEKKKEEEEAAAVASVAESKTLEHEFKIRPSLSQKFRPAPVQYWIEKAITEVIGDQEYSETDCVAWSQAIVKEILEKTKAMQFNRYKLVAQVTLGERRGQGATSAQRCLWDAGADCYATYTYLRDTLFCIGTVYAIYFY